jgi:hypothetical protein
MRRTLLIAAAMAITTFGTTVAGASGDVGQARVFPPDSSPFGQSYRQWAIDWFRWAGGTPTPANPFVHPDNCGPGASPRAWFLPGTTGGNQTATCRVPEGKGLLVSPLGNFCSGATNGVSTFSALRDCALAGLANVTAVRLKIDGHRVRHLNRFFVVTRKFAFHIPADNIFGVPAQTTPAVVVGQFIMIRPLEEGRHTVVAFVASPDLPQGFGRITFDITVIDRDA